jgi:hypothetical protein
MPAFPGAEQIEAAFLRETIYHFSQKYFGSFCASFIG